VRDGAIAVASTNRGISQEAIGTSIAGLPGTPLQQRTAASSSTLSLPVEVGGKGRSLDPVRLNRSGAPESVDAGLPSNRLETIHRAESCSI